jgi:putative ABC transport system permease protein
MLRNYFKIAVRSLKKNKGYSVINILGLVIGIAFSCMLYIYVNNELSYDSFHKKADHIYRALTIDKRDPANVRRYGVTVPPMGPELVNNYPEVVDMVRLHKFVGQIVLEINGESFQERNWYTTDPNFFQVFDFEFVGGDKETALKEPQSLVVTESMAKKLFGDKDPIGQVIEKSSFGAIKITGVIKDHPDNSHLKFDLLFSRVSTSPTMDDGWNDYLNSWERFGAYTYIVLEEPGAIASLRSKMPDLEKQHFAKFAGSMSVDFQAIEDIYLRSGNIEEGTESVRGQMSYIYIFSSMGLFLLIIACINYINLATSKAMMRSREIGVRKVVGADRRQLFVQFMMESFIITSISAIIALGIMDLVFPYFNHITGKSFDVTGDTLSLYLTPLFSIAVLMGLISGSYPALYLAKLKPVASLKGREVMGSKSVGLRNTLVVFQFVLTIVMIVSTLVVGRQLSFIKTKDIGFKNDRLMVIDINSGDVRSQFRSIKDEYGKIPGVEHVAVSSRVPGEWKNIAELYVSHNGRSDSTKVYFMGFDEDMPDTYGFTLESGRYFDSYSRTDSTNVIVNKSAVDALGLSDPLGAVLYVDTDDGLIELTVIGVMNDFNFQSLHQKISPVLIGAWNNPFQSIDYFSLKVSGDIDGVIKAATAVHEKFDHRGPIEYHFLDQQMELFYVAETRAGMIFRMGGGLSIFVACLGLFGLATFNTERRAKELGIRKVLGATGLNLFVLLSASFTKQVAIAFIFATPIGWYVMGEWLKVFEYKISLNPGIFLLAGMIALLIALLTVSYRILKAASANPVNSLKQE